MINRLKAYLRANQRYLPLVFFVCGFIWDSLTLGRIDRLYDQFILCTYLSLLTLFLYLFNCSADDRWKGTYLEKYEDYFPLAIQFFLGGLCSAYVIYFSRSVSFSKTIIFFIILVILLFANELLRKRISNKYLQFSAYFFVNFTFFTFFIPMLVNSMSTFIFVISGLISFVLTAAFIGYIYKVSPSTRNEVNRGKLFGILFGIYLLINIFYYFNLIPPVPLALDTGLVAHNVQKDADQNEYIVTYEQNPWYRFWKENDEHFHNEPGSRVYIFTSIFAPSQLKESVLHRWKWYSPHTNQWEVIDEISFEITGGREGGYRGFTFKSNMMEGQWKVDVITDDELVLGIINFEVIMDSTSFKKVLITRAF